jgi:hypothetical protein
MLLLLPPLVPGGDENIVVSGWKRKLGTYWCFNGGDDDGVVTIITLYVLFVSGWSGVGLTGIPLGPLLSFSISSLSLSSPFLPQHCHQ